MVGYEACKNEMIENIKNNQNEWLKYRNMNCNTATTGAQDTHFPGVDLMGCIINALVKYR